jgi:hypothetical protein
MSMRFQALEQYRRGKIFLHEINLRTWFLNYLRILKQLNQGEAEVRQNRVAR